MEWSVTWQWTRGAINDDGSVKYPARFHTASGFSSREYASIFASHIEHCCGLWIYYGHPPDDLEKRIKTEKDFYEKNLDIP